MKKKSSTRFAFLNMRALFAFALCSLGVTFACVALVPSSRLPLQASSESAAEEEEQMRDMPIPGKGGKESQDLAKLERFWSDRLTYPTGRFNPAWLRNAAKEHSRMPVAAPAGSFSHL